MESIQPAMPIEEARRLWFGAQALPLGVESPQEAVAQAGYIRTLGGVDVYLALRARVKDLKRRDVDQGVEAGDLRVVPAVRGCIYLVDRPEAAWALRIADLLSKRRRVREYEKSGIKAGELDTVEAAVLEALAEGPASTSALRKSLGEIARSLGAAGKAVGISSTLPPALRELEFAGKIERTLPGGRLDTERYDWRLADGDLLAEVTDEPAEVHAHMAEKFFRSVGVGSVDRFAAWAGIGKRDARAAVERLNPSAVTVEGLAEGRMVLGSPDSIEPSGGVSFLPFQDNLIQLQPGVAPLVDPRYHDIPVPAWGPAKAQTLGTAQHMAFRSIAVDGEVVGVWEFDPDQEAVVVAVFASVAPKVRKRVDQEAAAVGSFLTEEIGRAISFSIDTDDRLRSRATRIKEMAA